MYQNYTVEVVKYKMTIGTHCKIFVPHTLWEVVALRALLSSVKVREKYLERWALLKGEDQAVAIEAIYGDLGWVT